MNTELVSKALFDEMSAAADKALNLANELLAESEVKDSQIDNLLKEIERLQEENKFLKAGFGAA